MLNSAKVEAAWQEAEAPPSLSLVLELGSMTSLQSTSSGWFCRESRGIFAEEALVELSKSNTISGTSFTYRMRRVRDLHVINQRNPGLNKHAPKFEKIKKISLIDH